MRVRSHGSYAAFLDHSTPLEQQNRAEFSPSAWLLDGFDSCKATRAAHLIRILPADQCPTETRQDYATTPMAQV